MTSTVAHRCYRMITVATGENVMFPKAVTIEGHNNDGWFGDIIDELL
jgi:hypothetical protein